MSKLTFVLWNKHDLKGDRPFKRGAVGMGLVRAFSVTLAVFVMLAFVVGVTNQPVYNFATAILGTVFASAFMGGVSAGSAAGIRGWQHGGSTGVIYGMIYVVLGALLGLKIFDPVLLTVAMGLLGTIGGIIGVNLPAARKQPVRRRTFIDMRQQNH